MPSTGGSTAGSPSLKPSTIPPSFPCGYGIILLYIDQNLRSTRTTFARMFLVTSTSYAFLLANLTENSTRFFRGGGTRTMFFLVKFC